MKKLTLWVVLLAAGVLALSACSPQTAEPTADPVPSLPPALIAEGRLMPVTSLDHAFTISGQVVEVLVEDGEVVTAGQVLVRLKVSPEAEAVLARAESEVLAAEQSMDSLMKKADLTLAQTRLAYLEAQDEAEQAETRFEADETEENKTRLDLAQAALKLAEDEMASVDNGQGVDADQLAAAQARLDAARAAAASAQALINAHELTALMDGTVAGLSLQAGQQVGAGAPGLVLADFSTWIVKTENLTELEISEVETGQKVEVVLDALPGITLAGEVSHISTRFEEKRGDVTYTATIKLEQVDPRMRWGMTAAVRFTQ